MANRVLSIVLNVLIIVLLVVILVTLKKTIKGQNEEMTKISIIEQKLQGLDIQCTQYI